ncbi:hypothetical protein ACET3Z_008987 [Daucus carota]
MVHSYTPAYYSSLHDSITSICKNILPFSFRKKRLPAIAAAEQKLSEHQSENLKWQQNSFHQILKLIGLCKEGIVPDEEVSAFRTHLLDTLISSPLDHEHELILKDKLIFLQELLYAQCISEEEYHSSKRPLLQRLAVQGAVIEARLVIAGKPKEKSEEEWSSIDLKDGNCLIGKEKMNLESKSKHNSAIKQIKEAASVLSFVSPHKSAKFKEDKGVYDLDKENFKSSDHIFSSSNSDKNEMRISQENPFWNCQMREKESESRSILMASESLPEEFPKSGGSKVKKKPFRTLFQREGQGGVENGSNVLEEKEPKSGKKQWGFEGFKKWKKSDPSEDETAPLSLNERSDGEAYLGKLVASPIGEGPDTKQIKKKLNSDGSPSDFFVDKVLGDKIRKELLRIQKELGETNPNAQFTNDQIDVISTRLPVDKADLKKFFPKSWCDRYGDIVLNVVRKEFKDHVGEMKASGREKKQSPKRWETFDEDDDQNCHPNLFASCHVPIKQANSTPLNSDRLAYSSRPYW